MCGASEVVNSFQLLLRSPRVGKLCLSSLKARIVSWAQVSPKYRIPLCQRIAANDLRRGLLAHETSQRGPWNQLANPSYTLPLSEGRVRERLHVPLQQPFRPCRPASLSLEGCDATASPLPHPLLGQGEGTESYSRFEARSSMASGLGWLRGLLPALKARNRPLPAWLVMASAMMLRAALVVQR
jgi:hypothetical protein